MKPQAGVASVGRRETTLLLMAVSLVVLPHYEHLSPSIMGFFAITLAWHALALRQVCTLPKRLWLVGLTAAGAGLVFFEYQRFYGREAGAALFTVSLGLKLLEMKTARDFYLVVLLAFFVAVTQYLFSQSIPMAVYTLAIVVLLVTVLISLNSGNEFALLGRFKLAGIMVLQALPVMVLLFILFPRIPGPLWQLPENSRKAHTGLSDTIEPGSISRLGLTDTPAFRVDFSGKPPPFNQRYWRGPVFWHTDGRRWTLPEYRVAKAATLMTWGEPVHYTITLEPHGQRWVFALDLPGEFPSELRLSPEFLLSSKDPIDERRQYQLTSHTDYNTGPLSDHDLQLGLELPAIPSERMTGLVDSWRSSAKKPNDFVESALSYFRNENFYYTLNPPPISASNPVEGFLFETRKGFCEHYATAFVVLMRVAGVPARVVTGYQGGQWNPVGKFLEVKQADAHAWAEVWLPDQGWTRIDPTAAVAPERIERGVDVDTQIDAGEIRFNLPEGVLPNRSLGLRELWGQARQMWASVDHAWDLWILGYGADQQTRFFAWLGIFDWRGVAIGLTGALTIALGAIAILILPRRKHAADRASILYQRFLRKLARRGIVKQPVEGALSFAQRIGPEFPQVHSDIVQITRSFLDIRYGNQANPENFKDLQQKIKNLKV